MKRFAFLSLLLIGPAFAADEPTQVEAPLEILLMVSPPGGPMFFALGAGGCLRGPAVFKDDQGRTLFELIAGDEYPVGCGRQALERTND
jgi:hypothetical protein